MKSLVVIPTYNEAENIKGLIPVLMQTLPDINILVVDDNSPDGTYQVVEQLKQQFSNLHSLLRQKKEGLGRAYLAGFEWGMSKDFDCFFQMDADFSHRPTDLVKMVEAIQSNDFVIGSRYVPGGTTVNWGWMRKLISRGGSLYARCILGYPLRDWTGGFNGWKRKVLEGIGLQRVRSEGYAFQIELKYRAMREGFRPQEVPIVFEDRRVGQSKMSSKIMIEALYRVWSLRWA